jgi:hypothetical protein
MNTKNRYAGAVCFVVVIIKQEYWLVGFMAHSFYLKKRSSMIWKRIFQDEEFSVSPLII